MFFKKYMHDSSIGLGHRPFTAGRGVRFPYRVPDLITLVTKPVGNLVCPQLTELELLSYMNERITLEQLGP